MNGRRLIPFGANIRSAPDDPPPGSTASSDGSQLGSPTVTIGILRASKLGNRVQVVRRKARMPMICIFGASGNTGGAAAAFLLKRGKKIRVVGQQREKLAPFGQGWCGELRRRYRECGFRPRGAFGSRSRLPTGSAKHGDQRFPRVSKSRDRRPDGRHRSSRGAPRRAPEAGGSVVPMPTTFETFAKEVFTPAYRS